MKNLNRLFFVVGIITIALVMMGCQSKTNLIAPEALYSDQQIAKLDNNTQTSTIKTTTICVPSVFPIWAGQNINVGNVTVTNDATYLYVTYNITGGWQMTESHLHIANTLSGIPQTKKGIPIPGQFQYSAMQNPAVTTFTYNILLADHNLSMGDTFIIAAHAVVVNGDYPNGTYQSETGWGGNIAGPGPRWWFYLEYTLCMPDRGGDDPEFNVTTAMMRLNDNAYNFTYKWGTHPWFSYVKMTPVLAPQTFYFYAAQHNRVGEVQIWKDGGYLYVQTNLDTPYEMAQTHLNVQLTGYSGPPSFGLFPYTMTHDPRVTTYTYQVPWQSAWDNMELNIALHGEVGPF